MVFGVLLQVKLTLSRHILTGSSFKWLLPYCNKMSSHSRSSRSASEPLLVKTVELLKSDNAPKHHTSDYESNELVVRRGTPFRLMLTLSRALKETENVEFELRMGRRPMVHHGSLVRLPRIDPKPNEDAVGFNMLASVGDVLTIEIHTSAKEMGVGKWLLVMKGKSGRRRLPTVKVTDDIIILFNPWAKLDTVYMQNDAWRKEYVLNEDGMQFYGSHFSIGSMDWYFGQFEDSVMKVALKLLDMGKLRYRDQQDPVLVSRHMSAFVNSNDDDGVLIGNWSGEYDDGMNPSDWSGSVAILKQYLESGPVAYGQCWVFSGVLTTVMRCLGIPARSVTNFESAHDTDANLTLDYHYDKDGKPKADENDSIWNFHVWNDVWMARENLPGAFGGWQAIDATPQEVSDRKFQCGPMSLNAIKEGQINHDYDGPFIYAEVNATKKYWQEKAKTSDGKIEWDELMSESAKVGMNISTKALGAFKREDITNQYKYAEGSREEELSFKTARKYVKLTHTVRKEVKQLVKFTPQAPGSVSFGKDITFKVKLENVSQSSESIFLSVVAKTIQYNGSVLAQLLDKDFKQTIAASKSAELEVTLPASKYISTAKGNNSVKFFFLGGVDGSAQTFAAQTIVWFEKPKIKVEVAGSAKLGKPVKVKVSFTNPLHVALEGGVFRFEGAGLRDMVEKTVAKVKAHEVVSAEVSIQPRKLGQRKILVGFSSKQMQGLQGVAEIEVS